MKGKKLVSSATQHVSGSDIMDCVKGFSNSVVHAWVEEASSPSGPWVTVEPGRLPRLRYIRPSLTVHEMVL